MLSFARMLHSDQYNCLVVDLNILKVITALVFLNALVMMFDIDFCWCAGYWSGSGSVLCELGVPKVGKEVREGDI